MKKILTAALLAATASPAFAADWYVGFGAGGAIASDASKNVKGDQDIAASVGVGSAVEYDDHSAALSAFAGYRFNPYIRAEAAYDYLGVYDFSGALTAGGSSVTGSERDTVSAVSLAAIGSIPVTPSFSLYGKVGVAYAINDETCELSVGSCEADRDNNTTPLVGLGAEVFIGHNAIRLEFQNYNKIGDTKNEYTAGNFTEVTVKYVFYTR